MIRPNLWTLLSSFSIVLLTVSTTFAASIDCPRGGFMRCVDDRSYQICGGGNVHCPGQRLCDTDAPYGSTSSPCILFGTKCRGTIC